MGSMKPVNIYVPWYYWPKGAASMGDVVNLNRERKRRQRVEKEKQATLNRKKHGRHKSERARDSATVEREDELLDSHLIEDKD